MTPEEYCQQKTAASGSSFYYSFRLLPADQRSAITALYAICREIDDVVDEARDRSVAQSKLLWWREEIDRMYANAPTHPASRALAPWLVKYRIQRGHLHDVVTGCALDLHQDRYADFAALAGYCHHVAGVVGLMTAEIFGYSDPQTRHYAERLGLAFQLTNIIRDVGEDVRRGRIYLPSDELTRFGVSPSDLLNRQGNDHFVQLMAFQAERARSVYREAFSALPTADYKAQRPGLVMADIYLKTLAEIERDHFPVLQQRITLTPIRKMLIAGGRWLQARPPRV